MHIYCAIAFIVRQEKYFKIQCSLYCAGSEGGVFLVWSTKRTLYFNFETSFEVISQREVELLSLITTIQARITPPLKIHLYRQKKKIVNEAGRNYIIVLI